MADAKIIRYIGTPSSFRWDSYGVDVAKNTEGERLEAVAPDIADFLVNDYQDGDYFEYYPEGDLNTNLTIVDGLDISPETVDTDSVDTERGSVSEHPNNQTDIARYRDTGPVQSSVPLKRAGWLWFIKPRAVRHVGDSDKVYTGGIEPVSGDLKLASINVDTAESVTNVLVAGFDVDDHANPAFVVRPDGHIVVGYNDHTNNSAKVRISSNPEDISAFGAETEVATETTTSYCQLAQLSDESDRIYYFKRNNTDLVVTWSDDGGATWSGDTTLIQAEAGDKGIYWTIGSDDESRIDIGYTRAIDAGSGEKRDIRHIYIENSDLHTSDGTVIASLDGTNLPLAWDDGTQIYDSVSEGNDAWIWDCVANGGSPEVVYAELVSESNHNYRYAKWSGSKWTDYALADAGSAICGGSNEQYYSQGVTLDPSAEGIVYYGVGDDVSSAIYRAETHDGGQTWRSKPLSSRTDKNYRPTVPRNLDQGPPHELPVFWMRGPYNGFAEYATDIVANEGVGSQRPVFATARVPSDQTIASGSEVLLPLEQFNRPGSGFGDQAEFAFNSNGIKIKKPGRYRFEAFVYYSSLSEAAMCEARFERNSGSNLQIIDRSYGEAGEPVVLHGSITYQAAKGHFVELVTSHSSSSSETVIGGADHVSTVRVTEIPLAR